MPKETHEVIDLSGPDGNAYVLMGKARGYAKQLGLDPEVIVSEMMSGDYDRLLEVFDKYFGQFVVMYK